MSRTWRVAVSSLVATFGLVVGAPAASAHPLGNFTVNTATELRVQRSGVLLEVVVDSAEIPTLQAFPGLRSDAGMPMDAQKSYRDNECAAVVDGLALSLDGVAVPLIVRSAGLSFPPGEAGLATTRLVCAMATVEAIEPVGHELVLTTDVSIERIGWREVTAVGDGVELMDSDVPGVSPSDRLRSYPEDLLEVPLDQRGARVQVVAGDGVVAGAAATVVDNAPSRGVDRFTSAYTDFVASTDLGLVSAVLAIALAVLLGGLHAFAPGHGKALMAAYLIGQKGSLRQASLIGLSVTVTHTVGVLVLGIVLSTVAVTAPERIYPWLGMASGVLLAGIGFALLRRAVRGRTISSRPEPVVEAHGHGHGHGHGHEVQPSGLATLTRDSAVAVHTHGPGGHAHEHRVATDARGLLAVGFAGGLVPSPSALVVLLGGIALGRAWFGVVLVLAYGVGMALALVGTGMALVHARGRVDRWAAARERSGRRTPAVLAVTSTLPVLTASVVVVVGIWIGFEASRAL